MKKIIEISVRLKRPNMSVDYSYVSAMHGYMSKLLGDNDYGKETNRYTYTNIFNGVYTKLGIVFKPQGPLPYFIIRTEEPEVLMNFMNNIIENTTIFEGLEIKDFTYRFIENCKGDTFRSKRESPILFTSSYYNRKDELTEEDIECLEGKLLDTIVKMCRNYGIPCDNVGVKITGQGKHSNVVYRGIVNKGRVFEIKVNACEEAKMMLLAHGIGHSTSDGFGVLFN